MKRRQVFWVIGGFCGISLAQISHNILAKKSSVADIQPSPSPVASNVAASPAPAPDGLFAPRRRDVRIIVISDLNSQYGSTTYEPEVSQAIALIPAWKPDLVLCGGDMIAGQQRSLTDAQVNAMWQAFDQEIAAPLRQAKIPFGFTIGNHDGSGAIAQGKFVFQSERALASAYWNNPKYSSNLSFIERFNFPFYYTFVQNDIFYLVWDASTHVIAPEQLTWVEQQLSSSQAQNAQLRIIIGHLPLYAVAKKREKFGEFLSDGDKLRKILEKYDVHTYISGHHHAYYPGKKGQLELLHAGALGGGPRQLLNSDLPARKTLTVIDIDLTTKSTIYTTYDMKTKQVIDIQTLPPFIESSNGKIYRTDVAQPE